MSSPFPGFYNLLDQHRYSYPQQEALIFGDVRLSFQSLFDRVNALASGLSWEGVGESDRVLYMGQNSHAMVEILLACSKIGATVCYVNWRQSAAELAFVLEDFDPKVVFFQQQEVGEAMEQARARARASDSRWYVLDGNGTGSYEALVESSEPSGFEVVADPDTDRPLMVLYTAAFGGQPNGAQISEPGLFLQSLVHVNVYESTSATRTLVSGPGFHIAAWLDALPTFIAGGRLYIARKTDPADVLKIIADEQITNGTIAPPTAKAVAELNAESKLDISCFRSPLNVPGWTEMTSRGPGIAGCGQTEVVGPVIVGALAGGGSTPFCGRPAPMVQAKIVDDSGEMVEPGGVGELLIRGPVAGLGYWNRPELNAERTSPGGWWHTRDLARRDLDGTISFVGPIAQMVKTGGENVYAAEVENTLQSHPSVARAAIIGKPDPDWGQIVAAVIVLAEGQSATEDELREHVKANIARYKAPRVIHFADQLPLNGFAIDYKALDSAYGGGGYPGEKSANTSNIGATTR